MASLLQRAKALLETPPRDESLEFDSRYHDAKVFELCIALAVAVAFPIYRMLADRLVFKPFGCWALGIREPSKASEEEKKTLSKFMESAYKASVQLFLSCLLATVLVSNRAWVVDTRLCWSECMRLPCLAPVAWMEQVVYLVEFGFYTQAVPMLFLWETRRKDWPETLAHHLVTIALIGYSYYLNILRIGILVLACHEANDFFMEVAKMAHYARCPRWIVSSMLFSFVASWFATRVLAFPLVVIRSTLTETYFFANYHNVSIEPHYTILNAFLIFLYALHLYWTYLILRIVYREIKTGDAEDVREKDE